MFDGCSQLIVDHFILGPGWEEGCPSCSFHADHSDGIIVQLNARDVVMVAVSRASLKEVQAFEGANGLELQVGVAEWGRMGMTSTATITCRLGTMAEMIGELGLPLVTMEYEVWALECLSVQKHAAFQQWMAERAKKENQ
jgi:Bacterial protein of unknown function (DUF899)